MRQIIDHFPARLYMCVIEKYAPQKINLTLRENRPIVNTGMKYTSILSVAGMITVTTLFAGCASLSGAESRQNVQKLTIGMGENQVLNLLGTPDSVLHPEANTDRWIYEFKKESKKGHNLYVDFRNGEYARSGELSGRDVAAAEETRTPGTCTKWKNPEFVEESLCTR
jgi:outer membrane protein assembly factor BamE (lipoprotein component of BamABCDE complex)